MKNDPLLKILTILLLAIAAIGCDSPSSQIPAAITTVATPNRHYCVWDRMLAQLSFKTHHTNPRVQFFIKQFTTRHKQDLQQYLKQATPYLYHVVNSLEQQNISIELALLPILESEYRPTATSKRGAVGLWQFASVTGRMHGLKQDPWYDGRKDVDASTQAALKHLMYLYEEFDHDWLLTLAAYNAGDGRVKGAIKANKKLGKKTDYWSLSLPKETQHYVPKFLALVYVIQNSHTYGIELPHVPNEPYFTKVQLEKQIDLNKAAILAELDIKEVKKLNPEYRTNVTRPQGPHKILLPVKNASIFKTNLTVNKNAASKPVTPRSNPKPKTKVNSKPVTKKT